MKNIDETSHILISWGYESMTGKLYLDTFLNVDDNPEAVRAIFLRQSFVHNNLSYFQAPEGITREDIEYWLKDNAKAPEFLNKSLVRSINQVVKAKSYTEDTGNTEAYLDYYYGE